MNATPKATNRAVLKLFWEHLGHYKVSFFSALLLVLLASVSITAAPVFYKRFFDVIGRGDFSDVAFSSAVFPLVFALLFKLAHAFFWRLTGPLANPMVAGVMKEAADTAFEKFLHHSYKFFSDNFSGSLTRKLSRFSESFETIFYQLLYEFVPVVLSVVLILGVVFSRSPVIAFVLFVWTGILVYANYRVVRWKQRFEEGRSAADSRMTGALSESVVNAVAVKLFNGFSGEEDLFRKATDDVKRYRIINWNINDNIRITQGFLAVAVEIVVMFLTFKLYRAGVLTIGDFILFQTYIVMLLEKTWGLSWTLKYFFKAFADAKEMVEILETPYDVQDIPNATELSVSQGKIEFKGVDFNFNETRKVLEDFSLTIEPHEKVALIGLSGAGKTTVTKLLFRFYDVTSGTIMIDGQDTAKVTQESLRDAIALVPQEPILFHRSLMDNIRYGRRDATDEEVIAAAKQAHCHEFIAELPEGYDTMVGERGVKLSGGERQRVAIARAILKNAPILVLDEATSSLDSESEYLIQDALATLMRGKTVIVIAHRLSTIISMDRIIVLEHGDVRATGTHKELVEQDELYKKLWSIQAGGFLQDEEVGE